MPRKNNKADWNALKLEYITTSCTYNDLHKKHGASEKAISEHSKAEGWRDLRRRFREKTAEELLKTAVEHEKNRLEGLITAAEKAINVALQALNDDKQFNRYIVEREEEYAKPGAGNVETRNPPVLRRKWTEEQTFGKIDVKALREMTAVIRDLTGLMREFYNIPTPAQLESQKTARARLALEEKRIAQMLSGAEEEGAGTGIVLLPPVLEEASG